MQGSISHTMGETKGESSFCVCATPRTLKFVEENENICPDCGKTLVEAEVRLLEQLAKGGALMEAIKSAPSQNTGVQLKPPIFNGQSDPKHFFVK